MKTMCLVLLLALPSVAGAQSAESPPIRATGSFFALAVDSLDAATRWYEEKLGLRVVMRVPGGEHPGVTVLEGDGLMVELVERVGPPAADARPPGRGRGPRQSGLFKGGFQVADFDGTIATLRARGVRIAIGPFPARRDQRANAIFEDHAGNLIQVLGANAP